MPTADEFLSQSTHKQTAAEFLGGEVGFDPIEVGEPPIQEADFTRATPQELERIRAVRPIQEGQQKTFEAIDRFFGVPESLEDVSPTEIPAQLARTATRFGLGAAGFLPALAERLAFPPEGQTTLGAAGEEISGLGGMLGRFPLQVRELALRGIGADPTQALNPADRAVMSLTERITGKPFSELSKEIEQGLVQAPVEPFFSTLIGAGGFRGVTKGVKRLQKVKEPPPTRIGEITEPEPSALRIEEPTPPEVVSEQALKVKEVPKPPAEKVVVPKEQKLPPEPKITPVPVEPTPERTTPVLTNARIAESLKLLKAGQLKPEARRPMIKSTEEAIVNRYDQDALTIARSINKTQRIPNAAEQVGAAIKYEELKGRRKEIQTTVEQLRKQGNEHGAKLELERAEQVRKEMLEIATAMRYGGGTGVARSLQIRQMFVPEEFELSNVLLDAETVKGKPLSKQESLKLETEVKSLDRIQKELDVVTKKWQDELAKNEELLAGGLVNRATRGAAKTKVKRAKLLDERVQLKADIRELVSPNRLNDITGITVEGAYKIGQLALNYAKEAILTLKEVIAKIRADFPGLSEMDVIKAINTKNPATQGRARSEATKRVVQLKTQARLLEQIDRAEQGIFDAPKQRPPQPQEIRALQKKLTELRKEAYRSNLDGRKLERAIKAINELQDQLDNQFRAVRKKKAPDTEEMASAKAKIKELRQLMRVEDALADVNEQLRTGDFKVPRERPEPPLSVQRKQVELRRKRRQIRDTQEELAPLTPKRVGLEAANLLRTMKATADMSGTLRQGLVPSIHLIRKGQFKRLADIQAKSIRSFFSENTADMIDNALRSADHHYLREKAGLYLAERGAAKATLREEHFMSKVAEKIPIWGEIVKASDRHMSTSLNLLRTSMFDLFLEKFPNATMTELKAWADYVNAASGRGSFGQATNALSTIMFAPRFAASRFQTPWKMFKYIKVPRVRNQIAYDMGSLMALGSTALVLADLAGAEVGVNPREPDFGKIKIGDTRIDVWAGFQQPTRLGMRGVTSLTDKVGISGEDLPEGEKQFAPLDAVGRFAAYKLSPIITLPFVELWTGKTLVNDPVTPLETAARAVTPLVYDDIAEAYQSGGLPRAGLSAGLAFFGTAVNTYEDGFQKTRRDIRKLLKEGKKNEAQKRADNWNLLNPDRRIVNITVIQAGDTTKVEVAKPKSRKKETFLRPATQ